MQVSKQVSLLLDEFLSKYQFGLSDNSQTFGTLLTDLSKAFDHLLDGVSNRKIKRK